MSEEGDDIDAQESDVVVETNEWSVIQPKGGFAVLWVWFPC